MNLVFASGFSFPQHFGFIDYFDGVKAHFHGKHQVAFPPVAPFGSSLKRATQLADGIDRAFQNGPIHIIAHSMGGLDSRNLIAGNLKGLAEPGRIVTLTTLSTPHKGSPVADFLTGGGPAFFRFARRALFDAANAASRVLGIDAGALADLTTVGASLIPDVIASHPHISYHSYGASGRVNRTPTSVPLLPTHGLITDDTHQPNDGLVGLDSAHYGEFQGSWACDHADIVGHDLDFGATGFVPIHLAQYDAIVSGLEARVKP